MRVIIAVILAVFLFTLTAYSQLTDDDLAKIRLIVETENSKIKAEMTAIELRITQQIQESENRLRSELNQQLNARIHDFTIVFGIISGGFFLLFAAVLLITALRGRPFNGRQTTTILIIGAALSGILTCSAIAYEGNKEFGKIVCEELIIKDKGGRIKLSSNILGPQLSFHNTDNERLVNLRAGPLGGFLKLTSIDKGPRIHLHATPVAAITLIGEDKPIGEGKGITMTSSPDDTHLIGVINRRGHHQIYPKK